jgi:mono/diheme cytochrome c family protein
MFRFLMACGLLHYGFQLRAEVRDLRAFFQVRCSVCHGTDGTGRGPGGLRLGARNLASAKWLTKQDEGDLVAAVLQGRGAMPGFQRQLSEAEARRLLAEVVRPMAARKKA